MITSFASIIVPGIALFIVAYGVGSVAAQVIDPAGHLDDERDSFPD